MGGTANVASRSTGSLDRMRGSVVTLAACSFFTSLGAVANTPVPPEAVEIENRRGLEVSFEYSAYATEREARASENDTTVRGRAFLERTKLAPGKSARFHLQQFRPWVRWCLLEPTSGLPCEVFNTLTGKLKVTLE